MLSHNMISEVRRLLAAGHSRRQIARMTGISRGTINHIADRQRSNRQARKETELSSLLPQQPPVRCRACGGLVYPPCQLCRVRALMNGKSAGTR